MRRALVTGLALLGLSAAAACTPVKPPSPGTPTPDLPRGGGGGGGSGFGPAGTQFLTGVREGNGQVVISYVAP